MVTTANPFLGQVGQVVVFVLCVTNKTGLKFRRNVAHLCVGMTRHKGPMFSVGNIQPTPAMQGRGASLHLPVYIAIVLFIVTMRLSRRWVGHHFPLSTAPNKPSLIIDTRMAESTL